MVYTEPPPLISRHTVWYPPPDSWLGWAFFLFDALETVHKKTLSTDRRESVGAQPFGLEVVPLGALEVIEVNHVRLALVVAQHLACTMRCGE